MVEEKQECIEGLGLQKVDEHADQQLVDFLSTQVRANEAWKVRDKKGGEMAGLHPTDPRVA